MKKIILSMAGILIMGASVIAQDSTRTNTQPQQPKTYPQPATPQQQGQPTPQTTVPQQQQQQPSQYQYRREDMKVIQQDQLPESLRQTLRGNEYKGWEQSTIMQDPSTGEYLLEMGTPATQPNNTSPTTTQQNTGNNPPRVYRFDSNGKVIADQNKTGQDRDH